MKRLASALAVIPAAWLALTLVTPTPGVVGRAGQRRHLVPVDEATQLEDAHDCQLREGRATATSAPPPTCAPRRVDGFADDLWARQTTRMQIDRTRAVLHRTRNSTRQHPDVQDRSSPTESPRSTSAADPVECTRSRQQSAHRLGHRSAKHDADYIVCAQIQVVYAGVNLTSPTPARKPRSADLAGQAEQAFPRHGEQDLLGAARDGQTAHVEEIVHGLVLDHACALGQLHPEFR